MLKNKKGQVITLDVLFSVVIVILMFFMLFNVAETKIYRMNSININKDFEYTADLAFKNLVNNPAINCYVKDENNSYLIPSCFSEMSEIFKKDLGLNDDYKCNLSWTGASSFTINECQDAFNPNNLNYYYSIDFNGYFLTAPSREVSKLDYINSYKGIETLNGSQDTYTLRVWK
jgi:hypothetical protein